MCEKQTDLYTIKEGMCESQVYVLNAFIKMIGSSQNASSFKTPNSGHQKFEAYIYNKKFNKIYKDCINIIFIAASRQNNSKGQTSLKSTQKKTFTVSQ